MELTAADIASYLQTNAFSTERTTDINRLLRTATRKDSVPTKDISETLKLLNGSSKKLDTVTSNLKEMLEISQSITKRSSESDRQTAYAKLRSLSSGIDEVIDATTFNKQKLLNGAELNLASAGQYSHLKLQDLSTTNAEGLNLASADGGADIDITYNEFCIWNNAMLHIKGLNITNAKGSEVDPAAGELETGDYVVEVDYAGPKSSVIIKSTDDTEISRMDNVDLSGSGVTTVKFDCGVSLNFDKTQIEGSSIDKYDYEKKGPAVLYANMSYARVNTYDLSGSQEASDRAVSIGVQSPASKDAGGTFSIGGVGLGAVATGRKEAATGTYSVEVYKVGDYASAIMYDSWGNVVGGLSDVELNANGSTSLDFGNGVVASVKDGGFIGSTVQKATVEYKQAVNTYDDFDFEDYTKTIQSAIDMVGEQQDVIDKASTLVGNVQSAVNGTLSSSVHNTTSLLIKNLLGGGTSTSATSLLSGASSSNTGLAWSSSMIMNNLSTALGLADTSGTSMLSLLSGNVDSLNPLTVPTTNKIRS